MDLGAIFTGGVGGVTFFVVWAYLILRWLATGYWFD
jgi:hypothetical protein